MLICSMTIPAKEYVKKVTTVPEGFIDELFELYDERSVLQSDFVIRLNAVAKWLKCNKYKLIMTLKKTYKQDFDYTVTKTTQVIKKDQRHNNYKEYLLTPDCFKRLAMMSRSKNAELIRTYFIEVEGLFIKHRDQTLQGMQADLETLKRSQRITKRIVPAHGYLYVIKSSEKQDGVYKIGRSKDLIQRLRAYNTGRKDDVDLLYMYKSTNISGAEHCVKGYLKEYQLKKYKEVYQTNLSMIKQLIRDCANLGAKLVHKNTREKMHGGYYIVIDRTET